MGVKNTIQLCKNIEVVLLVVVGKYHLHSVLLVEVVRLVEGGAVIVSQGE